MKPYYLRMYVQVWETAAWVFIRIPQTTYFNRALHHFAISERLTGQWKEDTLWCSSLSVTVPGGAGGSGFTGRAASEDSRSLQHGLSARGLLGYIMVKPPQSFLGRKHSHHAAGSTGAYSSSFSFKHLMAQFRIHFLTIIYIFNSLAVEVVSS